MTLELVTARQALANSARQADEVAIEAAYRRGYLHGYSVGMDDLRAATGRPAWPGWQRLARFFDGPLTRWRYADHRGRFDLPPTFSLPADSKEGRK